jgi:type II secretory pathway predicted ATPase ExeA
MSKIYGRILCALRFLTIGEFEYKTPSDFKGAAAGESARNTKAIIAACQGRVLMIDEAYSLDDSQFGKEVLDTLVELNTQNDIAVVMAGYPKEMKKMLRDQNPGLARRMNDSEPFVFEDYTDSELLKIFSDLCSAKDVTCSIEVKKFAAAKVGKLRSLPNFGNAALVYTLFDVSYQKMKERNHRERLEGKKENKVMEKIDVEEDYGKKNEVEEEEINSLFGMDGMKERLKSIGKMYKLRQKEGRPVNDLVTNFVFTGSPGTGKSRICRVLGSILHSYGILPTNHVEETSGLDLSGSYVGQTKDKVQNFLKAAKGGCLFIDEAYTMGDGGYGKDVINKLLASLTEEEYQGKLCVILAGYRDRMDKMFNLNEGLKSRFTEFFHLDDLTASECVAYVEVELLKNFTPVPFRMLEHESSKIRKVLSDCFDVLKLRPGCVRNIFGLVGATIT